MKKIRFAFLLIVLMVSQSSCEDRMKNCVESMMNDGYSYDDAWDNCNEGRNEGQIRPD